MRASGTVLLAASIAALLIFSVAAIAYIPPPVEPKAPPGSGGAASGGEGTEPEGGIFDFLVGGGTPGTGDEGDVPGTQDGTPSRFLIPGYKMYIGDDPIPGTDKNAAAVAEEYKPHFFTESGWAPYKSECPDDVYYRIIHGWDPYAQRNAYLLIYYVYYDEQCCFPKNHDEDHEPIFVWVENIGSRPYRIAYDYWKLSDLHYHQVHKTYWAAEIGHYEEDALKDADVALEKIYTQDAAYFPQGRINYKAWLWKSESKELDIRGMSDIGFSGNNPKIRIPVCYNTFDWKTGKANVNCSTNNVLRELDDDKLELWYGHTESCLPSGCGSCSWMYCTFAYDISDPFHGLFWEDPNVCSPVFPKLDARITSIEGDRKTLTVHLYALYNPELSAVSTEPDMLSGLWADKFTLYVNGVEDGTAAAVTEISGGNYVLVFDAGSYIGNANIVVRVEDNVGGSVLTEPYQISIKSGVE